MVLPAMYGCSTEKEMSQRRNLMIPHKDELPRNSKYRGVKKRRINKHKKRHKKRRRDCVDFFSKEQIPQV